MSLDRNLFTLILTPNPSVSSPVSGTSVVDLVDPSGTVHYRKRRLPGGVYKAELYEPISYSLLACATAPSATSKHKTIELYNPTKVVELKFTGTLSFKWSFKWEEHEFEWRREECFIVRKPDPPVLVAITKEPPGRIKTSSVQILDYNLQRFDIDDRKGLEIVILFALLTFQDSSDAYHEPSPPPSGAAADSATAAVTQGSTGNKTAARPPLPPKPAPKTGVARIAELQQGPGQVNEVAVVEEGAAKDYAKYCSQLLRVRWHPFAMQTCPDADVYQDDAMLFISVRSMDAAQVPKVLQVVEETKRIRHKAGDPELHQYVLYDTDKPGQKGPKIINLDDAVPNGKSKAKEYTPPRSLIVHLSKIDMPELRPRGALPAKRRKEGTPGKNGKSPQSDKDKKKEKDKSKDKDKQKERNDGPSPSTSRLARSPPRGTPPRRPQSQYFPTSSSPYPHGSAPGPWTVPVPPPMPPRPPRPPVHHAQTQPSYRQSMYGRQSHYEGAHSPPQSSVPPAPPQQNSSGFLGRLLGK
ncbi:hypothetical protein ID866_9233 [Astraeus odoratus]|nr:hypothetical protein ID866_9233 [Astraeus odoratus]